jgi:hypothetical protein
MSYTALIDYYGKSTERIMLTRGPFTSFLAFLPPRVTFYLFYNYDYCIANNLQEK